MMRGAEAARKLRGSISSGSKSVALESAENLVKKIQQICFKV
jgi:hypothetical protein